MSAAFSAAGGATGTDCPRTARSRRDSTTPVSDETGQPISGGSGNLLLDSRPGGGRRADLPLQEREPGFYRVALPDRVQGPVQGQVTLTSAGASIHRSLLLSL
jgi:hypothetical protein